MSYYHLILALAVTLCWLLVAAFAQTSTVTVSPSTTETSTSQQASSDSSNVPMILGATLGSAGLLAVIVVSSFYVISKKRQASSKLSLDGSIQRANSSSSSNSAARSRDLEANLETLQTEKVPQSTVLYEQIVEQSRSRNASFLRSLPTSNPTQLFSTSIHSLQRDSHSPTVPVPALMRRSSISASSLNALGIHHSEQPISAVPQHLASPLQSQPHLVQGFHVRNHSGSSINVPGSRHMLNPLESKIIHRQNIGELLPSNGSMGSMVIIPAKVINIAIPTAPGKKPTYAPPPEVKSKVPYSGVVLNMKSGHFKGVSSTSASVPASSLINSCSRLNVTKEHTISAYSLAQAGVGGEKGLLITSSLQNPLTPEESMSEACSPRPAAITKPAADAPQIPTVVESALPLESGNLPAAKADDSENDSDILVSTEAKDGESLVIQVINGDAVESKRPVALDATAGSAAEGENEPAPRAPKSRLAAVLQQEGQKETKRYSKLTFKENLSKVDNAQQPVSQQPTQCTASKLPGVPGSSRETAKKKSTRHQGMKATWTGHGTILPAMERLFSQFQKMLGNSEITPNSTLANRTISVDSNGQVKLGNFQRVLSYPAFQEIVIETDLSIGEKIGEGGFGEVFKGKVVSEATATKWGIPLNRDVAIKRVKIVELNEKNNTLSQKRRKHLEERALADFMQEVSILYVLQKCPHIVKLYGCARQPYLITVTKIYCCSLMQYIHSQLSFAEHTWADNVENNQPWSTIAAGLMYDLALGVQAMHSMGYAHLDIKPGNMLLERIGPTSETIAERSVVNTIAPGTPWRLILTDFGLTKVLDAKIEQVKGRKIANANGLSFRYAAPEAFSILHTQNSSKSSVSASTYLAIDIYATAVTMFHCITREQPWGPGVNMQIVQKLVKEGKRPQAANTKILSDEVAAKFVSMIEGCWQQLPQNRWPIGALLQHLQALSPLLQSAKAATNSSDNAIQLPDGKSSLPAASDNQCIENVRASEALEPTVTPPSSCAVRAKNDNPQILANQPNSDAAAPVDYSAQTVTRQMPLAPLPETNATFNKKTMSKELKYASPAATIESSAVVTPAVLKPVKTLDSNSGIESSERGGEEVPCQSPQSSVVPSTHETINLFPEEPAIFAEKDYSTQKMPFVLSIAVVGEGSAAAESLKESASIADNARVCEQTASYVGPVKKECNIDFNDKTALIATDYIGTLPLHVLEETPLKSTNNAVHGRKGVPALRTQSILEAVFRPPSLVPQKKLQSAGESISARTLLRSNDDGVEKFAEPHVFAPNLEAKSIVEASTNPLVASVSDSARVSPLSNVVTSSDAVENSFHGGTYGSLTQPVSSLAVVDYSVALKPPELCRAPTSMTVVPPLSHTDSSNSFSTIAPKQFGIHSRRASLKAVANEASSPREKVTLLERVIAEEIQ